MIPCKISKGYVAKKINHFLNQGVHVPLNSVLFKLFEYMRGVILRESPWTLVLQEWVWVVAHHISLSRLKDSPYFWYSCLQELYLLLNHIRLFMTYRSLATFISEWTAETSFRIHLWSFTAQKAKPANSLMHFYDNVSTKINPSFGMNSDKSESLHNIWSGCIVLSNECECMVSLNSDWQWSEVPSL